MLKPLTHELLDYPDLSYGFFTRQGGVSPAPYESLNAGYGSDDDPKNVSLNRARIAEYLGTDANQLLSLWQCHSRDVIIVETPFSWDKRPKADGLVTQVPGIALSALAADCGPLLLYEPNARIIGACHAGWRGALSGVSDETITAMEALGARRADIRAVLGPCISQPSYEVGPEFRDEFVAENESYDRFFRQGSRQRPHFDLKRFILMRLREAGLEHIAALPDCTYAQPEQFFSYRYNTHHNITNYGRNISAIMLT